MLGGHGGGSKDPQEGLRPGRVPPSRPTYIDLVRDLPTELVDREELTRAEARKAAMLEAALDAVVAIDQEGRVTEFNPAAERMFGYRRSDVVGRRMVDLIVPPSLRERHRQGLARYLATARPRILGQMLEMRALRADGTEFPVELGVVRVDLPGPPAFTAYIRDITHRGRAEEALRQSLEKRRLLGALLVQAQEEERKRIAWDVHDDSIQAMTAVALRLQAIRRQVGPSDVTRDLHELEALVEAAIGRLRRLLFELGPVILDREGLEAGIRAYLEELSRAAGVEHSLVCRLDSEPPPDIRAILFRLAQEALTNVRKHARARRVEVLLEDREGGVAVTVRDDGSGFSPSHEWSPGGHFGLVTMRERAEIFGGWCRIESVPGHGTTVEAWLPRVPRP